MLQYTIIFCFALLHVSVGNENIWPKPLKSAKPAANRFGTIDIDTPGGYDGSADRDISGHGPLGNDDEDDDGFDVDSSGSHQISHTGLTLCQEKRLKAENSPDRPPPHQPSCTVTGEFEPVQCSAGSCWCVNSNGDEIINSRRHTRPDCQNTERKPVVVVPLESVPSRDRDLNVGGGNRDIHDAINSNNDDQHHYDNHDNHETMSSTRLQIFEHPGILAGIIGGAVFGLLCAVLLVMFIVYRMRKSDDSGYPLKAPPASMGYMRTPTGHAFA